MRLSQPSLLYSMCRVIMGLSFSNSLISATKVCRYGVRDDSGCKVGLGCVGTTSSVGLTIMWLLNWKRFCKLISP